MNSLISFQQILHIPFIKFTAYLFSFLYIAIPTQIRVPSSHSLRGSKKIIIKSFNRMKYIWTISKIVKIYILDG